MLAEVQKQRVENVNHQRENLSFSICHVYNVLYQSVAKLILDHINKFLSLSQSLLWVCKHCLEDFKADKFSLDKELVGLVTGSIPNR